MAGLGGGLCYGTKQEQLELLKQVLGAGEEECDEETLAVVILLSPSLSLSLPPLSLALSFNVLKQDVDDITGTTGRPRRKKTAMPAARRSTGSSSLFLLLFFLSRSPFSLFSSLLLFLVIFVCRKHELNVRRKFDGVHGVQEANHLRPYPSSPLILQEEVWKVRKRGKRRETQSHGEKEGERKEVRGG